MTDYWDEVDRQGRLKHSALTMTCLRAPVLKSIWQNNALYDHCVQAWLDASRPGYYKRIDK